MTGYGKYPEALRPPYWIFLKWPLDRAEDRTTGYVKHPGASISLYWNTHKAQSKNWILGKFKAQDKWACLYGTRGTHLSKVPSWAKHLAKGFTSQSEVAQIKTYPTSRKASLKRDKITYTSDEQKQLNKLSSFNMRSASQVI
jgi:hypothetical protein